MSHRPSSIRHWTRKFGFALRGLSLGIRGQSSFLVHFLVALVVVAAGVLFGVGLLEWCLLLLCIAGVMTAELFNSALEEFAKAVSREQDPHIGAALDMSSGAVLVAAIGSALVGAIVFLHRLGVLLEWWPSLLG